MHQAGPNKPRILITSLPWILNTMGCTSQLTPWSRVHFEEVSSHNLGTPHILWNPQCYYCVYNIPPLLPSIHQMHLFNTLTFYLCKILSIFLMLICPCIIDIIPNYYQKVQRFLIYLFLQMLYMFQAVPPPIIRSTQLCIQLQVLSTNSAACCYRGWDGNHLHLFHDSRKQQYCLTIPEAVCTIVCSWWWAEESPETCRTSVEINK